MWLKKIPAKPKVNASTIGAVDYCAYAKYLDSGESTEATERGNRMHQHLTASTAPIDRRCFVASYAFGPDHEITCYLRQWRDQRLKGHWFGDLLIKTYYMLSPTIINTFGRFVWFRHFSTATVRVFVSFIKR